MWKEIEEMRKKRISKFNKKKNINSLLEIILKKDCEK